MADEPDTGHYTRSFGAQLDPSASSLCRYRGLEQYYMIVSVSTRSPEGKNPPAFDSSGHELTS
jgi:hypothetical protein